MVEPVFSHIVPTPDGATVFDKLMLFNLLVIGSGLAMCDQLACASVIMLLASLVMSVLSRFPGTSVRFQVCAAILSLICLIRT